MAPSYSGFYLNGAIQGNPELDMLAVIGVAPKAAETLDPQTETFGENNPTLILWADADPLIPTADPELGAEAMAADIPGAVVELTKSDNHAFYYDPAHVDTFTASVVDFLETVG